MKLKYNDKMHAYWLDGKRCKGVSTAAKLPDDTYSLDQWRKRMVLLGVARSPHLAEAAAAHHDDRDKLNELAEQALVAAGSDHAATKGTAVHRIVERHILGEEIIQNEHSSFVVANFELAMSHAGLTPVPAMVEQVVVFPEERICGRFDHVAIRQSDGMAVMCDLKTGPSAIRYPHAVATQMAMYANAPLWAHMPPGRDGVTEKFTPPPAILDPEVGYVISMTDEGTSIYSVNLKLGWKCVEQVIFPGLRWRAIQPEKLIKKVV